MLLMAPECVEVYLERVLEFQLENLNPLRSLQDLPGFKMKIEFKDIINNVLTKMLNGKSLEVNFVISQKNVQRMIFDKKNDRKRNERKT